jgi:hypothetical protein
MVVRVTEDFGRQFWIVRKLTIESERKPLAAIEMVDFERLRVTTVVFTTSCVPHMPNGSRPAVLFHQAGGFGRMRQPEDFLDTANFSVSVNQLAVFWVFVKTRKSSGQLPAILHVQEHARNQRRRVMSIFARAKLADRLIGKVIDCGDAALVMEFAHQSFQAFWDWLLEF